MNHSIVTNIPKNPKEIYDYALSKSFHSHVDEKHTKSNPGFARKLSHLTYEEAFKFIQENMPHWVISLRNISAISLNEKDFWEFGGCNIASNDYGSVFIWINVDLTIGSEILHKFNLKTDNY